MKTTNISTYSQNQLKYKITDDLTVSIKQAKSPLGILPQSLFEMAARINKKRSFLFVSKVLGKHIPVDPLVPQVAAGLLAIEFHRKKTGVEDRRTEMLVEALQSQDHAKLKQAYRSLEEQKLTLPQPYLFVGFAETATALGHAMFACFEDAAYFHTTREDLYDKTSVITFEEEHSHATAHRCYVPRAYLDSDQPIVLVDDEMTTGKTAINIIRSIHATFSRKEYVVVSLLDWRNAENRAKFTELEGELGITIETVSLLEGEVSVEGEPLLSESFSGKQKDGSNENVLFPHIEHSFVEVEYDSVNSVGETNAGNYLRDTGRFGLSSQQNDALNNECKEVASQLTAQSAKQKTLVLGTGEFMYIPMKIASYMEGEVVYQSTTRSPIHPIDREDYAIRNGIQFLSPDDEGVKNYLYNVRDYEDIFILFERATPLTKLEPLLNELRTYQGKVHVVSLAKKGGEE